MSYLHYRGFPCPAVVDVSGPALLMERIEGRSLAEKLDEDGRVDEAMKVLAGLHDELHSIPAPPWMGRYGVNVGAAAVVLHLDLHPHNVIVGTGGPVVVDWSFASAGPAAADLAATWVLLASAPDPAGPAGRLTPARRNHLVEVFLAQVDREAVRAVLPEACTARLEMSFLTETERRTVSLLRDGSALVPGLMSRRSRGRRT